MNAGLARQRIELAAIRFGVPAQNLTDRYIYEILNDQLRRFAKESGILEKKATMISIANTTEHELPPGVIYVQAVDFDNYRAHKIVHSQVRELQDQVS